MENTNVLLRGMTQDSNEAEKILMEKNIEFISYFSNDDYHIPILFPEDGAYPRKGLNNIKRFAKYYIPLKPLRESEAV